MQRSHATRITALTSAALGVSLTLAACTSDNSATAPTAASSAQPSTAPRPDYTDGEYAATGWYGSGPSSLDITLTLADGVISDVNVGTTATNQTSLEYQEAFAEAVPDEVIGRSIDDAHVGKLGGASGCPDGFNEAIDLIKDQARA